MSAITLGEIVSDPPTYTRDAVHVAVAMVIAGEQLCAGQHVGVDGTMAHGGAPHVGVVDPFLRGYVKKGERFWLLMYPSAVTNMHHTFSSEALADEAEAQNDYNSWCGEYHCG